MRDTQRLEKSRAVHRHRKCRVPQGRGNEKYHMSLALLVNRHLVTKREMLGETNSPGLNTREL